MTISLPELNKQLKQWLDDRVRVDNWTLDTPSTIVTQIDNLSYPSNTAAQFPPIRIEFEKTSFGLYCRAEFPFRIVYRVSNKLKYDDLPVYSACAIVNNLYLDAVVNPAQISEAIVTVKTPDDGIDIQISDPAEDGKDWLIVISPQFYIEFKAAKAIDEVFQPPKVDPPIIPITKLDIATYRGDMSFEVDDLATHDLDRRQRLNN